MVFFPSSSPILYSVLALGQLLGMSLSPATVQGFAPIYQPHVTSSRIDSGSFRGRGGFRLLDSRLKASSSQSRKKRRTEPDSEPDSERESLEDLIYETLHDYEKALNEENPPEVPHISEFLNDPPSPFQVFIAEADEVSGLDDLIKDANQNVPAVTNIAVIDSKDDLSPALLQQLKDIQLLTSFINAYAAKRVYDARGGKPFNLANKDEALDFVVQMANNINLVATKSLAGYLNLGKVSTSTLDKKTTGVSISSEFLKSLFGSLSLTEKALKELTGLLQSQNGQLSGSFKQAKQNIRHMIFYYFFEPVEGIEELKVAKLRFYFLDIDKSAWNVKVPCGSVNNFKFSMIQVDTEAEMNFELVEKDRNRIVSIIEKFTKMSLDEVNAATSPKVITQK